MSEFDEFVSVLDEQVAGVRIGDMTAPTFCRHALSLLNNVKSYNIEVINLTKSLNNWIGDTMADDTKIDYLNRIKNILPKVQITQ